MKCKIAFAFGCFSWCACLSCQPLPAATPTNPLPVAVSPLDDGGSKLATGDTPGAIRSLQATVRARPNDDNAFYLLTVAYLHAGQNGPAADTANSALKLASFSPERHAVMAFLMGKAHYHAFLDDYGKFNTQAGSLPNMAQLLSQMATHQYPTARGDVIVTRGDVNAPDDFETEKSSFKDTLSRLQHRLELADAAYKDALALDADLPGVHDGLGQIRIVQGYRGEARREFQTELDKHGPNGAVYLHLGEVESAEGRDDEAVQDFRHAAALAPQLEAPYHELFVLYTKAKDQDRAQWARGMSALRLRDFRTAEACLSKTSQETADTLCAQAELALAQKQAVSAHALLTRARAAAPHGAEILSMIGDWEQEQGHHDRAIDSYHQALEADVSCGAAWYGIGLAYDGESNFASALSDYEQALQINPNNPLAELNLAADEADLGQTSKAAATLHDYLRRFPMATNVYTVQTTLAQLEAK